MAVTTPHLAASERVALRELLGVVNAGLDAPMRPEWERAAWAVPRSEFVPERIYLGEELTPCDRTEAPEKWLRAVYADDSVVTQVNDGEEAEAGDRWPSSSASAPSIVFRMLHMADVAAGHRVLESAPEPGGTRACWPTSPARAT